MHVTARIDIEELCVRTALLDFHDGVTVSSGLAPAQGLRGAWVHHATPHDPRVDMSCEAGGESSLGHALRIKRAMSALSGEVRDLLGRAVEKQDVRPIVVRCLEAIEKGRS